MGDVARRLGISWVQVQHLIWSGQIPAQRAGEREYYVWQRDAERLELAHSRGQS